ncbi:MAG: hypothetical protein IKC94_04275 [Lentisphaeria bacterium]|nr:hypothetical protein [Lentisphaeria bacterium]
MILLIELLFGAATAGVLTWLFFTASEKNIAALEKLCRNRIAGIAYALPAALLCVPLAIPVSPDFLILWLYPLAVVLPVLCYFHIDHYAARGVSFFLILLAYDAIHGVFENHIPGAGVITIILLSSGIAAIWLSAVPCTLRDIFRKAAAGKYWKYAASAAAAVMSLLYLYIFIMMIIGVFVK